MGRRHARAARSVARYRGGGSGARRSVGRFPAAGGRRPLAFGAGTPAACGKRHVLGPCRALRLAEQEAPVLRVTKAHAAELEVPGGVHQRSRGGRLRHVHGQIEHLEHPFETHQRLRDHHRYVAEGAQRAVQLRQVGAEGHHRSHAKRTANHQVSAHEVDRRRAHRRGDAHEDEEAAAHHRLPDAPLAHRLRLIAEAPLFLPAPPEQLDQQHAADVEGLVHDGAQARVALHQLARDLPQGLAEAPSQEGEGGQHQQSQHRQPPLQCQHDRHRRRHRDDVGSDVHHGVGDRVLGAHDIVVEPAHQFAALVAVKNRNDMRCRWAYRAQRRSKMMPERWLRPACAARCATPRRRPEWLPAPRPAG